MLHIKSLQNFISIHLNSPLSSILWPLKLRRWDSLADHFFTPFSPESAHFDLSTLSNRGNQWNLSLTSPKQSIPRLYPAPPEQWCLGTSLWGQQGISWWDLRGKTTDQNCYSKLHLILAVPFLLFPKWVKWNKRYVFVNAVLLKCPTYTKSTMWQDFLG